MKPEPADKTFVLEKADQESVIVAYLITSRLDPKIAAVKLCKEQSLSNTLGNDQRVIRKFSAKYIPSSITKINAEQFLVDIVFPLHNIESSLSMLLSAIGGDTFNIKDVFPIKVMSVKLPELFIKNYSGPKYGIDGLRKMLNLFSRPILCGPVKPCVGLTSEAFAQRAKEALLGGADIVKDDELICDPVYNRLADRVKIVSKVVQEAEKTTGEKKMYFAFIGSGSPVQIMKNAKIAKDNGADGFMISPAINGFEIIQDLKNEFGLPIIAHNAFVYSAYSQNHGINFSIFAFFQRLCGADIVITPAKYGTFDVMTTEEHKENILALLKEMPNVKQSFPAFCGGQSPKTVPLLKRDVSSNAFIVIAGTSLYDHPNGPTVGAKELRESLEK